MTNFLRLDPHAPVSTPADTHYAAVAAWLLDLAGLPADQWRAARMIHEPAGRLAEAVAVRAVALGWTADELNRFLCGVYAGVRLRANTPDELADQFAGALQRWTE